MRNHGPVGPRIRENRENVKNESRKSLTKKGHKTIYHQKGFNIRINKNAEPRPHRPQNLRKSQKRKKGITKLTYKKGHKTIYNRKGFNIMINKNPEQRSRRP